MSNYPDDIRRFDHDPRSPFFAEWQCPKCGSSDPYTECDPEYCADEYEGWVITGGAEGRDIRDKYGFEIRNHRLYPDDIREIESRLGADYSVEDVTPAPRPGLDIGKVRCVRLTKRTAVTEFKGVNHA